MFTWQLMRMIRLYELTLHASYRPLETPYLMALARDLHVTAPGAIGRVTSALEAIMRADAAAGRPFLAAMCKGKVSDGMPARGFFLMAAALGRYSGPATGPEAVAFVLAERAMLAQT